MIYQKKEIKRKSLVPPATNTGYKTLLHFANLYSILPFIFLTCRKYSANQAATLL
jgi:hypothetical protein